MKIRDALKYGIDQLRDISDSALLDADILLLESIDNPEKSKIWLNNNLDLELSTPEIEKFKSFISRRKTHEPVAYIINKKEFYGLDFFVDKRVLVPRPETEMLVNEAFQLTRQSPHSKLIVDVGTGSGAIIISLAKILAEKNLLNNHQLVGIDASPGAITVAKTNATNHKINSGIDFLHGSFLSPLKLNSNKNQTLIIIANLPYLKQNEYENNSALQHEPMEALVSGNNGLAHYNELFKHAARLYDKFNNINLILEHHPHQSQALSEMAYKHFPQHIPNTLKDYSSQDRITIIS